MIAILAIKSGVPGSVRPRVDNLVDNASFATTFSASDMGQAVDIACPPERDGGMSSRRCGPRYLPLA
jgi:hypothetical protein